MDALLVAKRTLKQKHNVIKEQTSKYKEAGEKHSPQTFPAAEWYRSHVGSRSKITLQRAGGGDGSCDLGDSYTSEELLQLCVKPCGLAWS